MAIAKKLVENTCQIREHMYNQKLITQIISSLTPTSLSSTVSTMIPPPASIWLLRWSLSNAAFTSSTKWMKCNINGILTHVKLSPKYYEYEETDKYVFLLLSRCDPACII